MAYSLEGRLLEVCDCGVLCPCWIGEDPDNGSCDSALAYRIDRGVIEGIVEAYGDAAARIRDAGFDGVEMHMAHAYTLSSFLSRMNDRRVGGARVELALGGPR